jgi:hypothetical protein
MKQNNKKNSLGITTEYREPFEILIVLFGIGLVFCIVYPLFGTAYLRSAALLMLLAFACLAIGGMTGFLFGIPKFLQSDAPSNDSSRRYQQNTNLEQVSDWLTKILVGIGLTQLGNISIKVQSVSEFVANSLSPNPANVVFSGSILIYFTILGFFFVYLWSRLRLGRAFGDADLENPEVIGQLISIIDEVESVIDNRHKESLMIVRNKLEGQLHNVAPNSRASSKLDELANEYDKIRIDMPPGQERTRAMGSIVAMARNLQSSTDASPEVIYKKGRGGSRVIALSLVRASPQREHLEIVCDAIANSMSAFEQYQALRAAQILIDKVDDDAKVKIRNSINDAIKRGSLRSEDTDRWSIAQKII